VGVYVTAEMKPCLIDIDTCDVAQPFDHTQTAGTICCNLLLVLHLEAEVDKQRFCTALI
jgi:hypothetical protein